MARLAPVPGQISTYEWVDVHPGDIIPISNVGTFITVTEDMINPDGTLKKSAYTVSDHL